MLSIEFEVSARNVFEALKDVGLLPFEIDGPFDTDDTAIVFKLDDFENADFVTLRVYRSE